MASEQLTYVFPDGKTYAITSADGDRFLANVAVTGACRIWVGRRNHGGYGVFSLHRRTVMAHRFAYTASGRSIPRELVLDHLCRTRACVNPDHLEPVTQMINTARGENGQASKVTCDKGHPFDDGNTYVRPGGHRTCRACHRVSQREYRQRRRTARAAAK